MKGLHIVPVRGTYYSIELNGVPVTKATYTHAQAQEMYGVYAKIYNTGWEQGHTDSCHRHERER